jgi:tellurite resistance protein
MPLSLYLIIFGTRGVRMASDSGSFHCPVCGPQSYTHHTVRRFFTLYFIPIIPLDVIGTYIECGRCDRSYHPDVLSFRPQPDRRFEAEFEIAVRRTMVMMCLADGVVDDEEIETIRRVFGRIAKREISEEEVSDEIVKAMQQGGTVGQYLGGVVGRLNDAGKEMVVKAAFLVAAADGDFAESEQALLGEIGRALHLRPGHVDKIVNGMLADTKG